MIARPAPPPAPNTVTFTRPPIPRPEGGRGLLVAVQVRTSAHHRRRRPGQPDDPIVTLLGPRGQGRWACCPTSMSLTRLWQGTVAADPPTGRARAGRRPAARCTLQDLLVDEVAARGPRAPDGGVAPRRSLHRSEHASTDATCRRRSPSSAVPKAAGCSRSVTWPAPSRVARRMRWIPRCPLHLRLLASSCEDRQPRVDAGVCGLLGRRVGASGDQHPEDGANRRTAATLPRRGEGPEDPRIGTVRPLADASVSH